ncbi:hypothetical protein F4821DRAFT_251190 [Hypoxylon rubiginosum]|uniref:Uncharacterized protein n=1 Tax=Hypoxylon rubiginosum TaxID=110542 RepID=A0ACC0CJU7_9PEZI|nr:hypothetical protein F4821DRAFT_251190 [Hypoxylon rubiginosum]
MQCIPLPQTPIHPATVIQLDSSYVQGYDGQGFSTYPDRQGWPKRATSEWALLFETPPRDFVTFLERWLFFGLVQTAFPVEASSFITFAGSPDFPILTTECLPALVAKYRTKNSLSREALADFEQALRMHGLLCVVSTFSHYDIDMSEIRTLPEFIETAATMDPRNPNMVTATSFLFDVLLVASKGSDHREEGFAADHQVVTNSAYPWTSPVWNLLMQDGWCPAQLSMACSRSNTASLWFLHHLSRPSSDQEHPTIQPDNRLKRQPISPAESLCTTSSCKYRRLNDAIVTNQSSDGHLEKPKK